MTSFTCIHTNGVYQQYKGNICNRAFKCGSELPEYVALILRNGGFQSPDRWLRELRNNHSKEYLLEQIKKTTKPLCISNQAYRDMALAAYKEEDNTLCIGYAAGSMTGGGWEMLQTHIKSYGGDVMLEGTFVLLPYIKKAALFFLLIVILFALFFSQGDLLILTECLILFMFPLYLLYRNISKIGKCEEGRRLVLLYLEKVLHANVEISVEEE